MEEIEEDDEFSMSISYGYGDKDDQYPDYDDFR